MMQQKATQARTHSTKPVQITYNVANGPQKTESFDFLIVACDPRVLPLTSQTVLEARVKSALTSFTFRTSLLKALRPETPQLQPDSHSRKDTPVYAVRFHPGKLASMTGEVYGFRDEVMARDPAYLPSPNKITWATTYQLDSRPLLGRDQRRAEEEFDRKRDALVYNQAEKWFDLNPQGRSPEEAQMVDYFPHFEAADLQAGLPWDVRDAQGHNNTMYVSSFTCFESVLHCYLYGEMLMDPEGNIIKRFPKNKDARIAVCGAGPSGLLFASQHLVKNGYNNFVIFEKQVRFGGKTFTYHKPAPADPSRNVTCELGTCYLSLGYEPMFHLFKEYDAGEVVALDKDTNKFRAIVDRKVADNKEEKENGVEYGAWTLRKNGPVQFWERIEMIGAGVRYLIVHYAIMSMTMFDCMPVEPPTELNVLENLGRLIRLAIDRSDTARDGDEEVPVKDLYAVLKDEKRPAGQQQGGLFDLLDDITDDIDDVTKLVPVKDLKKACRNVFNTTFAAFLDENDMEELKSVFIYGYQVQGYGTIDRIPAYYGMIWMTPAVLTGSIRQLFNPTAAASKRGTVNVVSTGWGTLWEKIVEKDLKGKIVLEANISAIDRVMSN